MEALREIAQAEKIVVLAVLHDLNLALRWPDLVVLLSDGAPGIGRASGRGGHDGSPGRILHVAARTERCSQGRLHVLFDGRFDEQAEMESTDQLVTGWARSSQFASAEFDAGARNPRQT